MFLPQWGSFYFCFRHNFIFIYIIVFLFLVIIDLLGIDSDSFSIPKKN